ncbi:MAG: hypothetical protein ABIE03_02165 [Patescibacteria group bacterium]|nr:hypothetical protein [Patescibacteria group bacterium]
MDNREKVSTPIECSTANDVVSAGAGAEVSYSGPYVSLVLTGASEGTPNFQRQDTFEGSLTDPRIGEVRLVNVKIEDGSSYEPKFVIYTEEQIDGVLLPVE